MFFKYFQIFFIFFNSLFMPFIMKINILILYTFIYKKYFNQYSEFGWYFIVKTVKNINWFLNIFLNFHTVLIFQKNKDWPEQKNKRDPQTYPSIFWFLLKTFDRKMTKKGRKKDKKKGRIFYHENLDILKISSQFPAIFFKLNLQFFCHFSVKCF